MVTFVIFIFVFKVKFLSAYFPTTSGTRRHILTLTPLQTTGCQWRGINMWRLWITLIRGFGILIQDMRTATATSSRLFHLLSNSKSTETLASARPIGGRRDKVLMETLNTNWMIHGLFLITSPIRPSKYISCYVGIMTVKLIFYWIDIGVSRGWNWRRCWRIVAHSISSLLCPVETKGKYKVEMRNVSLQYCENVKTSGTLRTSLHFWVITKSPMFTMLAKRSAGSMENQLRPFLRRTLAFMSTSGEIFSWLHAISNFVCRPSSRQWFTTGRVNWGLNTTVSGRNFRWEVSSL